MVAKWSDCGGEILGLNPATYFLLGYLTFYGTHKLTSQLIENTAQLWAFFSSGGTKRPSYAICGDNRVKRQLSMTLEARK